MIVKDIPENKIHVGMIIKSLKDETLSIVTFTDKKDDNYSWTLNTKNDKPYSGFYDNDCKCEVIYCENIIDRRNEFKEEIDKLNNHTYFK